MGSFVMFKLVYDLNGSGQCLIKILKTCTADFWDHHDPIFWQGIGCHSILIML